MARGETRFGSQRTSQVPGSTAQRRGGGEVGLSRLTVQFVLKGADAATSTNYGGVYIFPAINIPRDPTGASATGPVWQLTSARERHETAGSAGTVMPTKVPSGTAKASGLPCLATAFDLTQPADTNQNGVLHATAANSQFADGDELAMWAPSATTAAANVVITCEFKRMG
jgi:hypothetical protein